MQAHRECLAIRIILLNFTFRNHFRTIMKKCADNSNIRTEDKPKHSRQTSKNKEIESYLSTHYDFRFNTVLGRTEFSPKCANVFSKVSRYGLMVKCTPERGQKCSLFHLMVKCTPIIVELPSVYRGCKPLICFQ